MKKIRKICALMFSLLMLNTNIAFAQGYNYSYKPMSGFKPANVIQADVKSLRVPAGTRIKVRMENPVNSHNSRKGDSFNISTLEDVIIDNNIILPAGSTVRGRVGKILPNGYLSRGAEMNLIFDHVVTPVGRQIPVVARVSGLANITPAGTIVAGGGYWNAVQKNLDQGADIMVKGTKLGVDKGLAISDKLQGNGNNKNIAKKAGIAVLSTVPIIVLTPVGFIGGTAVGCTVFFGKSVIAVFKKGDVVRLNPGDVFEVVLVDPVDIPVN